MTGESVGHVRTFVSLDGLAVINRTLPDHVFHDGRVKWVFRQAPDGAWYSGTFGYGNNSYPGVNWLNEAVGPKVFRELDDALRRDIEDHYR
jgi:hypothetical protein